MNVNALRAHCTRCDVCVDLLSEPSLAVAQHALLNIAAHQLPPRRFRLFVDRIRRVLFDGYNAEDDPNACMLN